MRLAPYLNLRRGGLLLRLQGTNPQATQRSLDSLGLKETRVVACADDVIAWIQGVDESGARALEAALQANTRETTVRERRVLLPQK